MSVLTDLLRKGYLPVQLPPAFASGTFADGILNVSSIWEAEAQRLPAMVAGRFSIARSSFYRRATSILNPVGFYFLAKEIDTYWPQIEAHYKKSKLSRSIPTLSGTLRAIQLRKFSELHEEKVTSSAGFQYALVTDIGSFFPTIYTHTIPWALHTKNAAKKNRNRISKYFGNILDAKSMAIQDGQTIGLPIGPDSSHILAEVIAVAIDGRLRSEYGKAISGFRYVDDYFLFFDRREEAEKALAALARAVASFELQLNPAKTRIIAIKELTTESWKYSVKRLGVSAARRAQRDDIHRYFETLLLLERSFKDESLVKYGLKRISSVIVKKSNWQLFEAYLLKCGFSFPNTLQVVANLLCTYSNYGYPLDRKAIARFCNSIIREAAELDHHGEASWALWICKELALKVDKMSTDRVINMENPICTLILLDLEAHGLTRAKLSRTALRSIATEDALFGESWLLAYEGGRREWLGVDNDSFISSNRFFGPLNDADVQFYNEDARLRPVFNLKPTRLGLGTIDFDDDSPIGSMFDFDEMDEEYFDSASGESSEEYPLDPGDENEDEEIEF